MDIDITLPQQAYAIFESLNYTPWNALGEFIDNSIQSYLNNQKSLKKLNKKYKLRIDVNVERNKIIVKDNAAGIDKEELKSGLKPATKPKISEGLSEFGMGMKTASFWLSRKWSIITKHFNSSEKYEVVFDNVKIYTEGIRKIAVYPTKVNTKDHYTTLVLEEITIDGEDKRALQEIKENLASMYRLYLRKKDIELYFNGDKLSFEPYIPLKGKKMYGDNKEVIWLKELDFTLSSGKRIVGTAGLLATGKPLLAGFTYLRRNRVIEGIDEGKKVVEIFGTGNTKRSQRVFGEIHLDSFRVAHTKDKILFGNEIYEFKEKLKKALIDGDLNLLYQAENFAYRDKSNDNYEAGTPLRISEKIKKAISKNSLELNLDFKDKKIAIKGNIGKFSSEMKESYSDMYKIENLIRLLIQKVEKENKTSFLDENKYPDIGDKKIIRGINSKIEWLKDRETEEGLVSIRGEHDLYYTNFDALKTIIEINYDKFFKKYFAHKSITIGMLEHLYRYRNNIAHNCYLDDKERADINSALTTFLKQLNGKM